MVIRGYNLLKRIISITLDMITLFGIMSEVLQLLAKFLDSVQHAVDYPPKE